MPAVPCREMRYKNYPLSTLSYRVLPAESGDFCILTSRFRTVVDYSFCLLYHGDQSDAEKKKLEEGQIGDITYSFEKGEKKTDTFDHYNYYVQQGEDVYVVQNKGVSNGWFTSRSDESKKAFKKFIKTVKFE